MPEAQIKCSAPECEFKTPRSYGQTQVTPATVNKWPRPEATVTGATPSERSVRPS